MTGVKQRCTYPEVQQVTHVLLQNLRRQTERIFANEWDLLSKKATLKLDNLFRAGRNIQLQIGLLRRHSLQSPTKAINTDLTRLVISD